MAVYTKTGDKGKTSLVGGKRVPKNHPRIEAYGMVDELMSHTALTMDMLEDAEDKEFLLWVLDRLMTISSILASEEDVVKRLPQLKVNDVARMEKQIDGMEVGLEPMKFFILPGGHPAVSQCHVARTVCRRTERVIISMEAAECAAPDIVNEFINRLSDYFFVLSRKTSKYFNIIPIKWIPVVD